MARKMKDSGIEWIGEIPEDWKLTKVKHIGKYINGYPFKPSDWSDSGIPIIRIQNLTGNNCEYNYYNGPKLSEDYLILKNDYLISWSATLGVYIWHKEIGYLNQHIFKAIPNENIINYNYFYWIANIFIDEIQSYMHGSAMQHVTKGVFDNFTVPLPSKMKEQEKISDILNREVKYVDNIESKITQQIQTLEDYKKSVITEAVTKGLDKNVEMKDSGIEWIGEIPKHWERAKIKNACSLIGSGTTPTSHNLEFYSEDGVNWIQSGDLYKTSIITTTEKRISDRALKYYSVLKLYESPFLVMAMYGASVGNLSLSKINAATNQACCVMKPNKKTDLMFLYYWLVFVKDDLLNKAEGGSQPNISQDKIKNEIMYFPTLCEQQSISNYLDKKTAIIDETITSKQKQLGILEEYKKSLIYEYVTGKKEVEDVGTI